MRSSIWILFILFIARGGRAPDSCLVLPLADQVPRSSKSEQEHVMSDPSLHLAATHPRNAFGQESSPHSNDEGSYIPSSDSNRETGRVRAPMILQIL